MNSSSLPKKVQLASLKSEYIEALVFYKYSHSKEALARLNAIKNAYVSFKEEDDVRGAVG
jgi:hypothetical protein